MKTYRDLEVWQRSMDLVVECYAATKQFPKSEVYGLTSQLQRAAVSIPANIAEGQGRQHVGEFMQHLSIAYGSLLELETHIQIAGRVNFLSEQEVSNILERTAHVGRMLNALRNALKRRG